MSAAVLASLLIQPIAGRAAASGTADVTAAPQASVTFGERRIAVPSGGHTQGSMLQAMSDNFGHIVVRSTSNLAVDPADDDEICCRFFDLVAEQVIELPCPLCISIDAITPYGDSYVGRTPHPIVPEDEDGGLDFYLFDATGEHLITPGTEQNSQVIELSEDGAYVVFRTFDNISPADTDSERDFYRWSRDSGDIELISPGVFTPLLRAVSPDGTRVLFETGENIGIPGGDPSEESIYEWTADGITRRGFGTFLSISDDWTRIYMETTLSLDPADADALTDGYVRDGTGFHVLTEPTSQFATLGEVKADGSAWLIGTTEALSPDDTDVFHDVYIGSAGDPVLVTRGMHGASNVHMDASFTSAIYESTISLAATDTDDLVDVYMWDVTSPATPELISGTTDGGHVSVLAYSPDGSRAFLSSNGQLIAEDTDPFTDVYEYVDGDLALVLPGDQSYDVEGWTPDLQRIVVSAGDLSEEDTNGNIEDVYISDADFESPTVVIPQPGITGPNPAIDFGTQADDGVWFECRLDAGAWSPCAPGVQYGPLAAGSHTLDVIGYDAAGNEDSASQSWTVDATAPTATVPTDAFVTGSTVTDGATSVKLRWSATDAGAGVARHEVAISTNGGPFVTKSTSLTSPSYTFGVLKGKSYQARIRSVDAVGNVGPWMTGAAFLIVVVQDGSDSIDRIGTWKKVETPSAWGGTMRWSGAQGDRMRLVFGGRSLALVGRIGANEGVAKIYVDGTLVKKVNLQTSTTANRRVFFTTTWSTDAVRTIEIRVVGTDGHPRVYVDAIVIGT